MPRGAPLAIAIAIAIAIALAPSAAAQAPDPAEAVDLVCGVVPVDLPVCPIEEPPGPQPGDPAAGESPTVQPPDPTEPAAVAEEGVDAVEAIVEDPTSAPGRFLGLLATLLQIVKDLLGLPAAGGAAIGAGFAELVDGVASAQDAVKAGAGATGDAIAHAVDVVKSAVASLFDAPGADAKLPVARERVVAPETEDVTRLLGSVRAKLAP